jgi:hypothetical protein
MEDAWLMLPRFRIVLHDLCNPFTAMRFGACRQCRANALRSPQDLDWICSYGGDASGRAVWQGLEKKTA